MPQKSLFQNSWGTIAVAVLCNILWGSAFPFVKIGYTLWGIGSNTGSILLFAGIRFTLAGLFVLILSGIRQRGIPKISNKKGVALLCLVQTVLQYLFFYIGLSHTSGSNGSIVNATSTFFAVILAHFAYSNDKITLRKAIGSILGFAGVLAVTFQDGALEMSPRGEGLIILAAFVFACSSLLNKHVTKTDSPDAVTGYNLFFGGLILMGAGLAGGGSLTSFSLPGAGVTIYLALLSAVAFTLWAVLLKTNPVSRISVYNFIIPVSGTLLSALLLGENILQPRYLVSLILVCTGIIVVNRKEFS